MAKNHWSLALIHNKMDPEKIILSSDQACAIDDRFPKAQTHFLVLPKIEINSIYELQYMHLPLLEDMVKLANQVIAMRGLNERDFLLGFKLDALMQGLTMHVISNDFNSKHIKKPRHWISFHTPIFMPYKVVYVTLKVNGIIDKLPEGKLDELRNSLLQCRQCEFQAHYFGALKEHYLQHWQNKQRRENEESMHQLTQSKPALVATQGKLQEESVERTSRNSLQSKQSFDFKELLHSLQACKVQQKATQNPTSNSLTSVEMNQRIRPYLWQYTQQPNLCPSLMQNNCANRVAMPSAVSSVPEHQGMTYYLLKMPPPLLVQQQLPPLSLQFYQRQQQPHQWTPNNSRAYYRPNNQFPPVNIQSQRQQTSNTNNSKTRDKNGKSIKNMQITQNI